MIPVESLLNADGTLNMSTGASGALDLRGWQVTLYSLRGPVLTPQASAPAIASAGDLSALTNNGLIGRVNALAVIGSDLYVGGDFTQTADGSLTLNHIARYSGGVWYPLANNGLNGPFQHLVDRVTQFGPGDPGYVGGRWWIDNGDGIMDENDTFLLCPLLGPGRTTP